MKRKQLLIYTSLLIFVFIFIIFIHKSSTIKEETLYPIQFTDIAKYQSKTGFINKDGQVVIPPRFDSSIYEYSRLFDNNPSEGFIGVRLGTKWSFADRNGKLITKPTFDSVRRFNNGFAPVKIGNKWSFIDTKASLISEPIFDDVKHFIEEIAVVKQGKKWGLIDRSGKLITPAIFDEIQDFTGEVAFARQGNKWGLIDRTGKLIAQPEFDYASSFLGNYAYVRKGNEFLSIDKAGNLVTVIRWRESNTKKPTPNVITKNDSRKCVFTDPNNYKPISEEFDECNSFFSEGLASVVRNRKLGFVDENGKTVIPTQFAIANKPHELYSIRFVNGLSAIKLNNNQCGYINKQGEFVIQAKYSNCSDFDEQGIASVTFGIKTIYINRSGKTISNLILDLKDLENLYSTGFNWQLKLVLSIFICIIWIFAISIHELGHAIAAYWGGDKSVKEKGYLSLNPLKYTHPLVSIILPGIFLMFGGFALPGAAVYIEKDKLRNRWWQSAVSFAGPLASLLVSFLLMIPFYFDLTLYLPWWVASGLAFLLVLNLQLVFFNLLPIPPLDGYGIIEPWLPPRIQTELRKYSFFIFIITILLFVFFPTLTVLLYLPFMFFLNKIDRLDIFFNLGLEGFYLFNRFSIIFLAVAVGIFFLIKWIVYKLYQFRDSRQTR